MRTISAILTGAALASCTAVPPAPTRTVEAQRQYETLLAGKAAQTAMSCLPSIRARDMIRIDDDTVIFRESGNRVYVNHMRGPCTGLTSPGTTLVTNAHGPTGACSGDIARVVYVGANLPVGSCVWGDFIPYVRPRA